MKTWNFLDVETLERLTLDKRLKQTYTQWVEHKSSLYVEFVEPYLVKKFQRGVAIKAYVNICLAIQRMP